MAVEEAFAAVENEFLLALGVNLDEIDRRETRVLGIEASHPHRFARLRWFALLAR